MPSPLPAELRSPALSAAILDALERAYEANQDRYDPTVGHNPLTFGICTWQSAVHFLTQTLATVDGVSTSIVNQSLEIRAGRCRLRVHKLGDSEFDDARTCFPGNAGPASRMGRVEQLELALILQQTERPFFLDWVIGHYGNPQDGLRAIRLQAVGGERALDGTISRWEEIVTLFDAATGTTVPLAPATTVPDAVVIPEPDVALQDDVVAAEDVDLRQT
jgi:hypothetical protein